MAYVISGKSTFQLLWRTFLQHKNPEENVLWKALSSEGYLFLLYIIRTLSFFSTHRKPESNICTTKNLSFAYTMRGLLMVLYSSTYTCCLRMFIRRKTVLNRKMFIPAIRNPIETINVKFSDLKSLTLNAINNAPMIVVVQAIHLSISAAFFSLFIYHDPRHLRFSFHLMAIL